MQTNKLFKTHPPCAQKGQVASLIISSFISQQVFLEHTPYYGTYLGTEIQERIKCKTSLLPGATSQLDEKQRQTRTEEEENAQ